MFSFRRLLFLAAVAVAFAVVAPSRGDPPPPAPPPPGAAAVNRARELLWDLARRPELAPLVDYWRSADYRSHRLAGEVRSPSDLVECAICVDMLAALVGGWQDGSYTLEEMEEGLKDLCLQLEMLSEAGCDGIVENYAVCERNLESGRQGYRYSQTRSIGNRLIRIRLIKNIG